MHLPDITSFIFANCKTVFRVKRISSLSKDQVFTIELSFIPLSTSDRCHVIFVQLAEALDSMARLNQSSVQSFLHTWTALLL